jgi:hypothetical protein
MAACWASVVRVLLFSQLLRLPPGTLKGKLSQALPWPTTGMALFGYENDVDVHRVGGGGVEPCDWRDAVLRRRAGAALAGAATGPLAGMPRPLPSEPMA